MPDGECNYQCNIIRKGWLSRKNQNKQCKLSVKARKSRSRLHMPKQVLERKYHLVIAFWIKDSETARQLEASSR